MGSVETFGLRVKLLNLRERISEKHMEIRWLGERAHVQSLLSTLPLSVSPWREDSQTIAHSVFLVRISTLVRISMARRLPDHCPEWLGNCKTGAADDCLHARRNGISERAARGARTQSVLSAALNGWLRIIHRIIQDFISAETMFA